MVYGVYALTINTSHDGYKRTTCQSYIHHTPYTMHHTPYTIHFIFLASPVLVQLCLTVYDTAVSYLYGVWCMVYGVWCMVYGVRCTVFGVRYMVYSAWCMAVVHGVWCMVYGVWCMVYGVW